MEAYWDHEFDISGSLDVIYHVTIYFLIGHFLLVTLWNKATISNGFRDIQWRIWRNGWHNLKRPLNKSHWFWCQSISHIQLHTGCQ